MDNIETKNINIEPQDINKECFARLSAVQACYQISQNSKPVREVIQECLSSQVYEDAQGEQGHIKPHGPLLKKILTNVDERRAEIEALLSANIVKNKNITKVVENSEEGDEDKPKPTYEKTLEPLLHSILICAIGEILSHGDIKPAIIIDDYLNITHGFYEKSQVSFVNGILDKISKIVRT